MTAAVLRAPATPATELARAEANHAALLTRAQSLAGQPAERDAWILAGAAHRISAQHRLRLAITDRRDQGGTP
jgi:hypothetical protein